MIEHKMSLSPTLKFSNAGHISSPRSLRQGVGAAASKVTPHRFLAFVGLVASYLLAAMSYQTFVAPYQDLWPADAKLISMLLVMSPAVLLFVRRLSRDRTQMSRRNALLMLFSANILFVSTICFRFYWTTRKSC